MNMKIVETLLMIIESLVFRPISEKTLRFKTVFLILWRDLY